MQQLPTVAYIAGCTHSGTTLLNRILGTHNKILSIGGIKNLPMALAGQLQCSCGEPVLNGCAFWGEVDANLRDRGRSLAELRVDAVDEETFARDNKDLFIALKHVSGADVIMDTSRRVQRLRRLKHIEGLPLLPILLFKGPRRQVSSFRRKGVDLKDSLKNYWRGNLSVLQDVSSSKDSLIIQYEDLCREPDRYLSLLVRLFGLDEDNTILDRWGENEVHMLGGNRMNSAKSSVINLDDNWQKRLRSMERIVVGLAGFPVLVSCKRYKVRLER